MDVTCIKLTVDGRCIELGVVCVKILSIFTYIYNNVIYHIILLLLFLLIFFIYKWYIFKNLTKIIYIYIFIIFKIKSITNQELNLFDIYNKIYYLFYSNSNICNYIWSSKANIKIKLHKLKIWYYIAEKNWKICN